MIRPIQIDTTWERPEQWARCNECGAEVWFDAYVDYMGRLVNSFDDNICTGECDGPVGRYGWTLKDGSPEDETDNDDNEEGK